MAGYSPVGKYHGRLKGVGAMRRYLVVVTVLLGCASMPETEVVEPSVVSGIDYNAPPTVTDTASNAVFVVEEPTSAEAALWCEAFDAALRLWGECLKPSQVWLVHEPGQLVGPHADVWTDGEQVRFFEWDGSYTLCVAAYHSESQVQYTMAYAITMLYWIFSDADSAEFIEKFTELLDVIQGE